MALPDSWVKHLMGKLAVRYGDAWFRKWDGIPMDAVRADWAEVLDGLRGTSIEYGLRYLPHDYPPTAAQFRALCNGAPETSKLAALPAPEVNPARTRELRAKLASIKPPADPREWARRLQGRHERGERLTPAQIDAYRAALREPRSSDPELVE